VSNVIAAQKREATLRKKIGDKNISPGTRKKSRETKVVVVGGVANHETRKGDWARSYKPGTMEKRAAVWEKLYWLEGLD